MVHNPAVDPRSSTGTAGIRHDGAVSDAPGRRRARWSWLIKAGICVALMSWIVRSADLDAVFSAMSGADFRLLALAVGMQVLGAAIIALRWQRLLAVGGIEPGFPFLWGSTVSSCFFRQFLPSVFGGDAIRGYDAWRAGARPGFAAMSLIVDRLFGLLALVFFIAVAGLAMNQMADGLPGLWAWTMLAAIGVIGGLAVLLAPGHIPLPRRTPAKIHKMIQALRAFQGARGVIGPCLGFSLLLQINVVTFYWVLSQSLGLDVPYAAFYAIVPIAIFAMMAPFTINGIGIREAIFIFLLGLWGIDASLALAFAWIEFATVLAVGLVGGAVYALRRAPMPPRAPTMDAPHGP
ncbi:MAG: lysylphosphatidylglycerol synthase transmembrane domain-containing protein [Pseudomonadota bacterium]